MSRTRKYRAWVEVNTEIDGQPVKFGGMVHNVAVYSGGGLGASLEDFNKAFEGSGWYFDDSCDWFRTDDESEYVDGGQMNAYSTYSDGESLWVYFDGEAMDFTGLTDRNGVEIYEGDICKFKLSLSSTRPTYDMGQIIYDNCTFRLKKPHAKPHKRISLSLALFNEGRDKTWLDVIGNKWQNPELLEQK